MLEHMQHQLVDFKTQVLSECDAHTHVTQFGEYLVDGDIKPMAETGMDQERITIDRDTPFLLVLCMDPVDVLQVEEHVDFGRVLPSTGGVVGFLSIEHTNHLYKGHLYHICYGACSRQERKYDCNHLVIFDEEQGICGAQYVIDGRPPWRRSAFSPGNDDMTAAPSMFHQILSWNPNDFSPWSSAWFSIVGLQKFQYGDHSNH
jgi:hypothetical protein